MPSTVSYPHRFCGICWKVVGELRERVRLGGDVRAVVVVEQRHRLLVKNLVDEATRLTPVLESTTVSPLQDSDWVAVRAMVKKSHTNNIMDELYNIGARAILVTNIHACRI